MEYYDWSIIISIGTVVLLILGLVIWIGAGSVIQEIGASNGYHTGTVTAVEHNSNIIWASNNVYFKSDAQSSQEDIYCVNDKNVMQQLNEFAKTKAQVTIHYQNEFLMWKWDCNSGISIIDKVTED